MKLFSVRKCWGFFPVSQDVSLYWNNAANIFLIEGSIEKVYSERAYSDRAIAQIANYDQFSSLEGKFRIMYDRNDVACLVWKETEEEVVFDVQGFLTRHSLPPPPRNFQ